MISSTNLCCILYEHGEKYKKERQSQNTDSTQNPNRSKDALINTVPIIVIKKEELVIIKK